MSIIQRFPLNVQGRDFVVGDIHGMFALLRYELANVSFDESKDRLFSVGDLVDRGPDSEESIEYIAKPWFHAVRGNHEQLAIDYVAWPQDRMTYAANGGQWFLDLDEDAQRMFAEAFDRLPYLIEINTPKGRVGIVHAEIVGNCWDDTVTAIRKTGRGSAFNNMLENLLWSRERIRRRNSSEIKDLHALYVGHTPVKPGVILGNVHYIDTGAVFGHGLTLEEL